MGKKKLSALELKMKKMAVLANDKFATKANTYTKQEVNEAMTNVTDGAQAAELYSFYVDQETMHLKGISTMANLSCFKVRNGHLVADLSVPGSSSSNNSE